MRKTLAAIIGVVAMTLIEVACWLDEELIVRQVKEILVRSGWTTEGERDD